MSKITIGHTETKTVQLDLPRLVDTRMLIQANSGGGKSWLLRLIIERAAKHVPVIILDPEGEFATLRERLDIALVGQGGEMAADVRSAALLARKLVELSIPAIIDLYDLKLSDRRAYVRLFLDALMSVPRAHWHPLLVVLDEAHLFAPERSAGEAESTAAVIGLMSQGRKRGFAGILSTQRFSKLHKDAEAECNNVFIGRTWLDNDLKRSADHLGFDKAQRTTLRQLEPGEFYAFGPALQTDGVVRFRSDAVATTHPKAGERHKLSVPQASAAIQEVVAQIGDLPAQAEQEAKDMAQAKAKIAELERQLRARPVVEQPRPVEMRIEIPVFRDGEVARMEGAIGELATIGAQLVTAGDSLRAAAGEVATALRAVVNRPAPAMPRPQLAVRPVPSAPGSFKAARGVLSRESTQPSGDVNLKAGERKMLQALAQRHPLKYTRAQVGTLAGFTPSGGTFTTYFGTLKRAGFITETNGEVEITDNGLAYLGTDIPPAPSTTAEMLAMWRSRLKAGEAKMLDALVEIYPDPMTRAVLGDVTGFTHTGGTFTTYLGTLRRNYLIEVRGDQVKASPTLFVDQNS